MIPDQAVLPLVATKSRILAGASLATFDAEIVAGLSIETVRLWASLPRMQIAVRNDSGGSLSHDRRRIDAPVALLDPVVPG